MRSQTCCFTGHRQIPPEKRLELAGQLERVIVSLYQRGVRFYGAGGALGFDCLAAQTVLRLRESCPGMKLILVLPCLTQTRGWPAADVAEYERIKGLADKVVYTSQAYTAGCMHKRNRHASFFVSSEKMIKVANEMKQKKTIGGSIGLLIGIVIVILALVRGSWQLPLLIGTFAVWGLWLLCALLLPSRRTARKQRNQAGNFNRQLAQTLLHHVNYRVSACLKAGYPDARWEWMMRDPALFVAQGGTGRIRVYGVPDYEFADVTVDQNGKLSCSLVKLSPMQGSLERPAPPNRQPADPQQWYEAQGRQMLETLVTDLDSRGHNTLMVQEDGSIRICPEEDGEEVTKGVLADFPARDLWPRLAELLERDGLAATVQNDCIVVTW